MPGITPHYLVAEPTTNLYTVFDPGARPAARLTYRKHATRFPTAAAALVAIAEAGLNEQPHELVRVDA